MSNELPKSFRERMDEAGLPAGKVAMQLIYSGEYIPDLAVMLNPGDPFHGWLFYRHPDDQWVSLADLKKIVPLLRS